MSKALNATGRPILYSLCNWGEDYPFNWASTIANSWRITGDIYDEWDKYDARCPWYFFSEQAIAVLFENPLIFWK